MKTAAVHFAPLPFCFGGLTPENHVDLNLNCRDLEVRALPAFYLFDGLPIVARIVDAAVCIEEKNIYSKFAF
jgi:hypothetical protein